ncbi:MAG: hypothetical protein AB7U25_24520 [Vicinamibacterales bacterium]
MATLPTLFALTSPPLTAALSDTAVFTAMALAAVAAAALSVVGRGGRPAATVPAAAHRAAPPATPARW